MKSEGPVGAGVRRGRPNRWVLPLVMVLVLGSLWSFRGVATPDPHEPVEVDSVGPSTTTTVPSLEGDLSTGWTTIDLPGSGEVVDILGSGFGLFGVTGDHRQSSLWRSSDGIVWEPVPDEGEIFVGAEVNSLVESEFGLVAVGARIDGDVNPGDLSAERRRPAVWLSSDGITWERIRDDRIGSAIAPDSPDAVPGPGSMTDVVVWEDRLVAVGWSRSPAQHGAAWVSDLDGRSWTAAPPGLTGSERSFTEVNAVSVFERQLIAVGTILGRPAAWVSPDSMTWSLLEPKTALGTQQHVRPTQVAAGGAGVVAIGVHRRVFSNYVDPMEHAFSLVWLSSDAEEWLTMEPEELGGVALDDVIAAPPWLLAAGSRSEGFTTDAGVWFSTTGAEWQAVDLGLPELVQGVSRVNVIARWDSGLVAGGILNGRPQVWLWRPDGTVEIPDSVWKRQDHGDWVLRSELPRFSSDTSLGVVPNGYLASGAGDVWFSPDAVSWEPIEAPGLVLGWGGIHPPVTIDGVGYLVVGGALWSSRDGRTWDALADGFEGWLDGPRPGLNGELLLIEYPDWGGLGVARLWRSPDGVQWVEYPLPELDWVSDIQVAGDAYVLFGWSPDGPTWRVSTGEGRWDPLVLDEVYDASGDMVTYGNRLVVPVVTDSYQPVTRVLSSLDGLTWEVSRDEIPGRPGQIVESGSGLVLVTGTDEGDFRDRTLNLWSSVDGLEWTDLGPVPGYLDLWPQIVPGGETIMVVIHWEGDSSIWEWVPPAG